MSREAPRRRGPTKLVILAGLLAALYFLGWPQCRKGLIGFGLGDELGLSRGDGEGSGSGPGTGAARQDGGVPRCQVRVDAKGLSLSGAPSTLDQVVTACRAAGAADVVVTGDAPQGAWDELRGALSAGVELYIRGAGAPLSHDAGAAPAAPAAPTAPAAPAAPAAPTPP